jgi:YD repeat-containing protein
MNENRGAVMTYIASALRGAALAGLFVLQGPTAVENYQHDAIGRLTDVAYANGESLHYTYDANGTVLSILTSLASGVEGGGPALQFALGPALPNPGSGPRNLVFSTPSRGHVTLRVFDVSGRQVATLVDTELSAGPHSLRFFTDRWGNGVYYYRLQMAGRVRSGRMVVLR